MANKQRWIPEWISMLLETMGLSKFISIIIGVPAMISLIYVIWHSLSLNQQIVASVCVVLILFAIAWFIYGQTRKVLYMIPTLLYEMRCWSAKLAGGLNMKAEDTINLVSLTGVDVPDTVKELFEEFSPETERLRSLDIESLIKDNSVRDFINWIVNVVPEQIEYATELDKDIKDRLPRYAGKSSGLEDLLAKDKIYQKLSQRLEKLRPLIPTAEISAAVNKYIKAFRTSNSLLPSLQGINNELASKILPLKFTIDISGLPEKVDDVMGILLAEVRESIDKYYRGN